MSSPSLGPSSDPAAGWGAEGGAGSSPRPVPNAPSGSAPEPGSGPESGSEPHSVPAAGPVAPADRPPRPPVDPVSVAAFVVGGLGIVFFGIGAAIVTALLASEAGKRARADGRSQENSAIAMGLAFVNGALWLFLHYQFELPIWIG